MIILLTCHELMDYLEGRECITVEDRKAAVEAVKNFEKRFFCREEKTQTLVFEVKISFPNLSRILNNVVKSRIMLQIRKIVPTIINDVLIKLIVEVILSLIRDNDGEVDYNMVMAY